MKVLSKFLIIFCAATMLIFSVSCGSNSNSGGNNQSQGAGSTQSANKSNILVLIAEENIPKGLTTERQKFPLISQMTNVRVAIDTISYGLILSSGCYMKMAGRKFGKNLPKTIKT